MTLFEYLAIAFSLVCSFTALRLLAGLPHAAQPGRRYWVHFSFACAQLLVTVVVFWIFWSYRDTTWTFPRFLLVLSSPALIYFNTCTLIPENPPSVESWNTYYYSVRRRFFIGQVVWVLVVAVGTTVMLQLPWAHPARLSQSAFLLIFCVGAVSDSRRIHSGLALCSIAIGLIATFTLALRPGSLAP